MTTGKLGWVAEGQYTGNGKQFRYQIITPEGNVLKVWGDYGTSEWIYTWGWEGRVRRVMTSQINKLIKARNRRLVEIRVEV